MQALEVIVPYFRTKHDSIKVLYGTIPIGQKGDPDLKVHVAPASLVRKRADSGRLVLHQHVFNLQTGKKSGQKT